MYIFKTGFTIRIKMYLVIEEEAHIREGVPRMQHSVTNSTVLSLMSQSDRTGTQKDTQLDWDRPTESYL